MLRKSLIMNLAGNKAQRAFIGQKSGSGEINLKKVPRKTEDRSFIFMVPLKIGLWTAKYTSAA